jgi:TRAP-type C4-dicarboxylate transport system permease small subunit
MTNNSNGVRALRAANRLLVKTEQVLAHGSAAFILAMMLVTVIEITSRRLLGYSIEGVFEGIELMLVIVVYLGLANVQRMDRNIRVELLLMRVPFRVKEVFEACTMGLVLVFFSFAIWMTGKKAWGSWLIKETTFLPAALPVWVARGIITIGIFFLWLRLLIQIGECIHHLLRGQQEKDVPIKEGD